MRLRILGFVAAVLCAVQPVAFGAEILVPPGAGTLVAAIASASDGDTLVLRDGAYGGAATVDKSLTIRPVDRFTEALVVDVMTISGVGIDVTIQGLTFAQDLLANRAARVNILQNHWLTRGLDVTNYKTSEGDGDLLVVGNLIDVGDIKTVYSDGAYIAGNVLNDGRINASSSVWIVGNEIHNARAIEVLGSAVTSRIIGNRLSCASSCQDMCVSAQLDGLSYVVSNLIELVTLTQTCGGYPLQQFGIYTAGLGYARILNNVVRGRPADSTRSYGYAISPNGSAGSISGNIVLDFVSAYGGPIGANPYFSTTHNICFNNSSDCPAGEGNLNVDPQFVDLVDYKLASSSPAIDAGPPDYTLADLDRTRNDIGAYGGPWSIGQYDAQRSPTALAPYVYPLFTKDEVYSGGVLDVQALGVARLR